jgi:transposase
VQATSAAQLLEPDATCSEQAWPFPFSPQDWAATPEPVRQHLLALEQNQSLLQTQVDELLARLRTLGAVADQAKAKLGRDSTNSNQPPSADNPYRKPGSRSKPKGNTKGKAGAKKGHPGHARKLLPPTQSTLVSPEPCSCGNTDFTGLAVFHTHQEVELPDLPLHVHHHLLQQGACTGCGALCKARIPIGHETGFGPRLTALVGEVSGMMGDSRSAVKTLLASVWNLDVSLGAIQKMIDRVSNALIPHYEAIGQIARAAAVNHADETPWYRKPILLWLWVLTNPTVAFFMIHPYRSKQAFLDLVDTWKGILVCDGYGVYTKWINLRQHCLAHLIRRAKALSETQDLEIAAFGRRIHRELQRLVHMAHDPPTTGQWNAFYARFVGLLFKTRERTDDAGILARTLLKELDHLWLFLEVHGVAPTNNLAERMIRFGVLWRKRSQGTASEKGDRWVERILTVRQTCRLRSVPTYAVLVDAVQASFFGRAPDLSWLKEPAK